MTVGEGHGVVSICCVTKIVFSRQREEKQGSKWISDPSLILRPMSHIWFPHPRFTFQQKAAPYDLRIYLANVTWECNRVICGGRDVLTGPKLLSNTPNENCFLQGWKRSWAFGKFTFHSFSEAFQFLGCSWTCFQRRGDTLGKQRDAPSSSPAGGRGCGSLLGQCSSLPGSQFWVQLSKPRDGRMLRWLDSPARTSSDKITFQLLYMCSSQPSALSRALIKHRPCGRHCARYSGPVGRDLLRVCLPGKMKSGWWASLAFLCSASCWKCLWLSHMCPGRRWDGQSSCDLFQIKLRAEGTCEKSSFYFWGFPSVIRRSSDWQAGVSPNEERS